MSRRTYSTTLYCAEEECHETSFFESSSLREERESLAYYTKFPWRCYRHTKPDEVLSSDNPQASTTLIATETYHTNRHGQRELLGQYWGLGDEHSAHRGYVSGPGFRAVCKDFPPGTRLIVTARVEFPEGGDAT